MLPTHNKQVFQQVITVILLMLGISLNYAAGLKCYSCNGATCNAPGTQEMKECPDTMGACITSGAPGSKKKDCVITTKSECIKAKGDCYNPASDSDRTKLGEINTCIGENTADHISDQGSTCVCNSDLCNADSANATNPSPNGGSGNSGAKKPVTGGIRCYSCKGDNNSPCWLPYPMDKIPTELCEGCYRKKSIDLVERRCINGAAARCGMKSFAAGCYNIKDYEGMGRFKECTDNEQVVPTDFPVPKGEQETTLECVCHADLCNTAGHIFSSGALAFVGVLLAKMC